jgi:hypothetical protein
MTDTKEQQITDPHGLLESGEKLLPLAQLASVLGCSKNALRELLHGPLRGVRWARREPEPAVYCVADAWVAFEPHRAEVEAKRLRHIELEASGRAAADTARAGRIAVDAKRKAEAARRQQLPGQGNAKPSSPAASPKPSGETSAKKSLPPTSSRRQTSAPEVIVLTRRPSVRPPP